VFSKIVLALDGSDPSDRAIPFAQELAKQSGGRIDVVHVREIVGGRGGVHSVRVDEDSLESKVVGQVDALKAAGVTSELHRFTANVGGPAHQIAEVAEQLGADVIVVGTRGHSSFGGFLSGSVTQRLLHLAHCPVLAVPPPKQS
jgi:nucleotide-binding universal stress UspA family protein